MIDNIKKIYNDILLRNPKESDGLGKNIILNDIQKELMIKELASSNEYYTLCGLYQVNKFIGKYSRMSSCKCKQNSQNIYWKTLWNIIHVITFIYPDKPTEFSKRRIVLFFENLGDKLPCPECKKHYGEHIVNYPISNMPNNKKSYISWLIDLHNDVNKRKKKPILSYEQVYEIYDMTLQSRIIKEYGIDQKKLFFNKLVDNEKIAKQATYAVKKKAEEKKQLELKRIVKIRHIAKQNQKLKAEAKRKEIAKQAAYAAKKKAEELKKTTEAAYAVKKKAEEKKQLGLKRIAKIRHIANQKLKAEAKRKEIAKQAAYAVKKKGEELKKTTEANKPALSNNIIKNMIDSDTENNYIDSDDISSNDKSKN